MNTKNKVVDAQFIIRVIKNEVTEEEKGYFNQWLEESDDNKEEFGKIALLWDKTSILQSPLSPNISAEWEKLRSKILVFANQTTGKTTEIYDKDKIYLKSNSKDRVRYFSEYVRKYIVFARVALIIFIFLAVYQFINSPLSTKHNNEIKEINFYNYITNKGERATIPLADGSIINLNADSKLTYPQYFEENRRFLKLEGEAYFSVKSDSDRPFIVQTGDKFIEVKGTEFNIKYRKNKLSVVVTKGKVVLYNQDSSKYLDLKKGELTYSTINGFTRPIKVDTRLYTAWRENKLSFIATSFSDVMDEIERFYNVKIICKNKKILNQSLTGFFDTNSLDEILMKISIALDFKFQRKGENIIIF